MTQEPTLAGKTTNSEQPAVSAGTPPDRDAATRSEPVEAPEGTSEDDWRAVIGPKRADYYLPRFASAASGGRYSRWHWPALFVTGSWFLYRKMWGWAFIYLIGLPILTSILFIVLAGTTSTSTFAWLTSLWILLVLATPPLVANRLYFGHCRNLIEGAKERFSDRSRQLAYLASKGGTSGGIALTVVAVLLVLVVLDLRFVAIAKQEFIRRARVSEAVAVADGVAKEVGSFYEANGSFPTDFSAIRDSAGTSKYLISIELNRVNGVIAFHTRPERDSTIAFTLTPSAGPDKHISWKCALADAPAMKKYAPKPCRD